MVEGVDQTGDASVLLLQMLELCTLILGEENTKQFERGDLALHLVDRRKIAGRTVRADRARIIHMPTVAALTDKIAVAQCRDDTSTRLRIVPRRPDPGSCGTLALRTNIPPVRDTHRACASERHADADAPNSFPVLLRFAVGLSPRLS